MTNDNGAKYVKIRPTLRIGTNWVRAIIRKKKFWKYLNWLKSTSGRNVSTLYLVLETRLLDQRVVNVGGRIEIFRGALDGEERRHDSRRDITLGLGGPSSSGSRLLFRDSIICVTLI